MDYYRYYLLFVIFSLICLSSCSSQPTQPQEQPSTAFEIPISERFAYPVGKTEYVTQARDKKDEWFNAQDFGENNHLGEDWNKNSGGNTDCGEPVFATSTGKITYAADAGPGWGNVIIITHYLPDGSKVQSLYGHLQDMTKTSGAVTTREKIGTIGNANGKYLCHLHFEIRTPDSPLFDQIGPGYSADTTGFTDPSDFIDAKRSKD